MDPIVKDMALTPEEFFRSVPIAMRDRDYRVDGGRVETGTPDRGITISIRPLPPRRLSALLSMPRSEVTIAFRGCSEAERVDFLSYFDQVYRRGGG